MTADGVGPLLIRVAPKKVDGSLMTVFVCLSVAVLFGQSTTINFATDDPGKSNTWHTLRVSAGGDQFVGTYDGKQVLDAKDGTFKDAGKVGLWTKADSIIYFDDFSVAGK